MKLIQLAMLILGIVLSLTSAIDVHTFGKNIEKHEAWNSYNNFRT